MKVFKSSALILLCSVTLTGCDSIQKTSTTATTETATTESAKSTKKNNTQRVIHVSSASQFDSLIANNENVLVDFHATWCGPCKRLGPIIDQLAQEIDNVTFVKVDVDQVKNISNRFGIRGIPALLFFKDGTKVRQESGFKTKNELKKLIKNTF